MGTTEDIGTEILGYIGDVIGDLTLEGRLMVLTYVGEHCKAHAQTILAHEYHRALYKPKGDE